MKDTAKRTWRNIFGSLVSNASAVEGAKTAPWWVAVILLVLGITLPTVPSFVSSAKSKGTDFLSNSYGLGLDKTFGSAINSINGDLVLKDNILTFNGTENPNETGLIGSYVSQSGNCKDQYELKIYFSIAADIDNFASFVEGKRNVNYVVGSTNVSTLDEEVKYKPSSIYFSKDFFYMEIYSSNSTTLNKAMNFYGDFVYLDNIDSLKEYFNGSSFDINNEENRLNSFNKLQDFINVTYKTSKKKSMLFGTLIYLGVYLAINFLMGLMCFLMTRGKKNPFRYLSFFVTQKVAWWASFCPGLLGLITGFIFRGSGVMLYVMFIALRTMWLSMKEFRPAY